MKRIVCFLAALLLLVLPVGAEETAANIMDYAGLLTAEEVRILDRRAQELTEHYSCQVAVVTVESLEGRYVEAYAESVFDALQLGWGSDRSCVLLLLSMEERDYDIMAHGRGNYIFTDYGKDALSDCFLDELGKNDWYGGLSAFLEGTVCFFENYEAGSAIDVHNDPVREVFTLEDGAITVGACLIPALIAVLIMKARMKNVKTQRAAANYAVNKAFRLRQSTDRFLWRSVRRVKIESSGSHRGGGTHISSHGSSHHSGHF